MQRLIKRNRRSHIAMLAIAGMFCGCGQTTELPTQSSSVQQNDQSRKDSSTAEATEVTSKIVETPKRPELNWTDFPFMQSSDSVVAVMSPATLAESPSIRGLVAVLPLADVSLTIPPSETNWVAVYANPLVNGDNSLTGEMTLVIQLNRPASVFEIAESRFQKCELEEAILDGHAYLKVTGLSDTRIEGSTDADGNTSEVTHFVPAPAMAVYEYDESTFVVCEEARLSYVLNQQHKEGDLRTLVAATDSTAPLFFAASIKDRTILKEALAVQAAEIQKGGMLQVLAANTDQMILSLDTDNEQLLHMSVTATDAEKAASIDVAIQKSLETGVAFLEDIKTFEPPQTAPIFDVAKSILTSVTTTTNQSSVEMTITNPGNLPEAIHTLHALLGMEVVSASVQ